jgi:hypothetical protein
MLPGVAEGCFVVAIANRTSNHKQEPVASCEMHIQSTMFVSQYFGYDKATAVRDMVLRWTQYSATGGLRLQFPSVLTTELKFF